jgi:hypothetical protein
MAPKSNKNEPEDTSKEQEGSGGVATAAAIQESHQEEPQLAPGVPEKPVEPKSVQAASMPAAATASATATVVPGPAKPRSFVQKWRECEIKFEDDGEKMFPGYSKARIEDMLRGVLCHVAETFSGTIRNKNGKFEKFSFIKNEVVKLPHWFALRHPNRLVIKE